MVLVSIIRLWPQRINDFLQQIEQKNVKICRLHNRICIRHNLGLIHKTRGSGCNSGLIWGVGGGSILRRSKMSWNGGGVPEYWVSPLDIVDKQGNSECECGTEEDDR